jgi:hypothetical protein
VLCSSICTCAWLGMRNRLNEELSLARQAGMEKQLRTLVDLEALLNDGTAYVLFFLLRVWAEGRHQSAGDAVRCCPAHGLRHVRLVFSGCSSHAEVLTGTVN